MTVQVKRDADAVATPRNPKDWDCKIELTCVKGLPAILGGRGPCTEYAWVENCVKRAKDAPNASSEKSV